MAKRYADAGKVILDGLKAYVGEVTAREFPQPENDFGMNDGEYEELLSLLDGNSKGDYG